MTSIRITPKNGLSANAIDLDEALQRGRRMRAQAFTSMLKSLFSGRDKHEPQQDVFPRDCTAAA